MQRLTHWNWTSKYSFSVENKQNGVYVGICLVFYHLSYTSIHTHSQSCNQMTQVAITGSVFYKMVHRYNPLSNIIWYTCGIISKITVDIDKSRAGVTHIADVSGYVIITSNATQWCCQEDTFSFTSRWDLVKIATQYQRATFTLNPSEKCTSNALNSRNIYWGKDDSDNRHVHDWVQALDDNSKIVKLQSLFWNGSNDQWYISVKFFFQFSNITHWMEYN